MTKRIGRTILGQPFESCEIIDWAARVIEEARGAGIYFNSSPADDDPNADTLRIVHDIWGEAFRRCPRHDGIVYPSDFAFYFTREVLRHAAEYVA